MKTFMAYFQAEADAGEGAACLVFANSLAQAVTLATPVIQGWFNDVEPSEIAVKQITEHLDYLEEEADQEKLRLGIAHVIESLRACPSCEMWGGGRPFHETDGDKDSRLVCQICYDWDG